MIKNKVGLEAEFILYKGEEIVFPSEYGFSTDQFVILGEVRADPGETRADTVANFMKEWYKVQYRVNQTPGLAISPFGYGSLTPKQYTEVIKRCDPKEAPKCENIYGTDLSEYSDAVVVDGKVQQHNISAGLHIHFSSLEEQNTKYVKEKYSPVSLPVGFNGIDGIKARLDLFKYDGYKEEVDLHCQASRITKPVINYIVKAFDEAVLPNYKLPVALKYRHAGFYEIKPWGFEYRSLPFNSETLKDLMSLVDKAFTLLGGL